MLRLAFRAAKAGFVELKALPLKAAVARRGLQSMQALAPGAETGAEGTPRVGLVTRLKVEAVRSLAEFGPGESVIVPEVGEHARFERPVLHATLRTKRGLGRSAWP